MIVIERNAFVCCFGVTRTGKSEVSRALWIAQPGPRVAVDVKDDLGSVLPGVPTVSEPSEILNYPTCRAVPPDPSDDAWYDELYRIALRERDYLIWLDEGNEPTSSSFIPRGIRTFILQGKGKGCGHFMCSPRPADVHKTFESQADHFFIFELQNDRDRIAVAKITGLSREHVDERLNYLEQFAPSDEERSHHYLYFRRGMRELRVFDPLDDPADLTAQIASRSFGPAE